MERPEAKRKFSQADRLYREGFFQEALIILDDLARAFPEEKNILFPRARCLAKLGRQHEAVDICNSLITHYNYSRAQELKARILGTQSTPGSTEDSISFDTLDLGLDAPLVHAPAAPEGLAWGRVAWVAVLVLGTLTGMYLLLFV